MVVLPKTASSDFFALAIFLIAMVAGIWFSWRKAGVAYSSRIH